MKKYYYIIVILTLLSIFTNSSAQDLNFPKTTQNGKEFYIYEVKDNDGLYKISKSFNVSQEEILKYNQQAVSGINIGMTLMIPINSAKSSIAEATKTGNNYIIHKVEAHQTVYSIAKQYNVLVNDIYELNENAKNGITIGMELKIPNSKSPNPVVEKKIMPAIPTPTHSSLNTKEHIVVAKETLYSLSKLYNVSTDELIKENPELSSVLRVGQKIRIPTNEKINSQPSKTVTIKEKTVIKQDVKINTSNTVVPNASSITKSNNVIKVALLLPFMLNNTEKQDATINKFVEFYEGVLLSINKLKQDGVSVQLITYDIEKTELKAKEVLQTNLTTLRKVDLIIGPAYSAQVKVVSDFSQANNIPLIVPFAPKIESISTNPLLFQNNTPQQKQFAEASKQVIKNFGNKNIVILDFNSDTEDEGSEFAKFLKINLKRQKIAYKELPFTQENYATIQNQFLPNKETILLFATDKPNLIKDLLPKIAQLNSQTSPISVFGFSSWDKTIKNYPSTYFCTSFFVNRKSKNNGLYREKFRQEFGVPATSTPRFDLMGFDLSYYFIKAYSVYGKSFPSSLNNFEQTQALQSKFHFEKQNQGGFINTGVRLIHYTEEKEFEIIE